MGKARRTTKTRERKKQKTKHDNSEEDSNSTTKPQQRVTILGLPCLGQKPPIVDSMKIGSSSRRANLRSSKTKNLLETGITNFSRCSRPQKSKEHFTSTHATRQLDDLTHQVPESSRVESTSGYIKQMEPSLRHKEIEKGGNGVDEEDTEENFLRNYRALKEIMEEEVGQKEVTLVEKPADEDNEEHQVPQGSERESPSRYLKGEPNLRCREIEKRGKCVAEEITEENLLRDVRALEGMMEEEVGEKEVTLAEKSVDEDNEVESRECPMEIVASRIPSLAEKSISRVRFPTLSLGLTKFVNMEVCEENEVDSQRCTMDTVEGYRVKAESMAILKKILDRHGDIAKNCTAFTAQFRSGLLEMICGIISDLQGKDLKQIKEDFLHHNIALVDDMKNMELDVEWLRVLLNDILKAKQQLGGKFGKLKEEKDINKKNIEEAERKLAECQERKRKLSAQFKEVSALLESTLDEEIVRKEALAKEKDESTKITEAIKCATSKVIRFLDCSSLDDLV